MTHRASILPLFKKNLVNESFFGFQKKLYKLSKLGGGGGGGNLNKIQKNSNFFFGKPSPRHKERRYLIRLLVSVKDVRKKLMFSVYLFSVLRTT